MHHPSRVFERLPSIPFAPTGPFRSGDFQTIYAALLHRPGEWKPDFRTLLPVSDGSAIACDWNLARPGRPARECAILIHGLEASSQSNYIVSTGRKLRQAGFDVCRANLRNCGGTERLSPTFYNAGLSGDIAALIGHCRQEGYARIYAAGFSLGANIVLRLAGEYGGSYPRELAGICAVSPPLDLAECSQALRRWRNVIYDRHYLQRMKATYLRKHRHFPEHFAREALQPVRQLYDFDNHIVAPAFRYRDAEDYYRHNSSQQFLAPIRLPTLIVQAQDDPIIPFASTRRALGLDNPYLHFLVTPYGGHVGFINSRGASRADRDALWAENRVVEFALAVAAPKVPAGEAL